MLKRMLADVDTTDIEAVRAEADRIYQAMYPDADAGFLAWACDWFRALFGGRYADYQPVDVPYHDREHTMQGLLCLVRLLHGRHRAGASPTIPRRTFELGVLAILLHDTGYLKRAADTAGTGAKYTLIHVDRSVAFAGGFLRERGYRSPDVEAVQNMIQGTAMQTSPAVVPYERDIERTVGAALATADLLGQMAADDYVDRLPQLFLEFSEACAYFGERARRLRYDSAEALIAGTPTFWRAYVKPRLDNDCQKMYRYLNDPYPDGGNDYLERVEANVAKAARRSAQAGTRDARSR